MLKEDQENATNGKLQDSVQEKTIAVSAAMGMRPENQHLSPLLLVSREKMVNNFREGRAPEVGVHLGS